MPMINFSYLIEAQDNPAFARAIANRVEQYSGLKCWSDLAALDSPSVLNTADGPFTVTADEFVGESVFSLATAVGGPGDPELIEQWKRDNWGDGEGNYEEGDPQEIPGGAILSIRVPAGVVSVNGLAMAVAELFAKETEEPKDPIARQVLDEQAPMAIPWRVDARP